MTVLPIRLFGDAALRKPTAPVTAFDDDLARLANDMIETMQAAHGAGLAAAQVGVGLAMFVYDVGEGPEVVINPTLSEPEGSWIYDEGCLSLPGVFITMERPMTVTAKYQNLQGEWQEVRASELLGRVFQHETEHCNGDFFTELAEPTARKAAMKQMRSVLAPGQREWLPGVDENPERITISA